MDQSGLADGFTTEVRTTVDREPPRFSPTVFLMRSIARTMRGCETPSPHQLGSHDLLSYARTEFAHTPQQFDFIKREAGEGFFDRRDVLEFGCGFGGNLVFYAANAKAKSLAGIDLHKDMPSAFSALAKATGIDVSHCKVAVGDGKVVPFESESFDSIFSIDVIEHVDELKCYLAEAQRLLRSGGKALFAFPSIRSIFCHHLDPLPFPGIHHIFGYKHLIAGLNHERTRRPEKNPFPLIGRVRDKTYRVEMHPEMSGVDADQFLAELAATDLRIVQQRFIPPRFQRLAVRNRIIDAFYSLGLFRESLSNYLSVVVIKP